MEHGLTFGVVDTPSPDRRRWPTADMFQTRQEIYRWRDLPLGIFRIHKRIDHGQEKYGPSVVLKLEHWEGPFYLVWAPNSVIYEMEKRNSTEFIINHGQQISMKTGNSYFDFQLF